MNKTILFGKEARDKIVAGVKKITDAVRVTMGSSGKCVLIGPAQYGQDGMLLSLPTLVTKDGYTVTKHFSLTDLVENRGAMMIKEAAYKTVMEAGDATTCTCVLADALIDGGVKLVEAGANAQEVKRGIEAAVETAVKELQALSIPVKDSQSVLHVASVSANNDAAIGKMIADAFEQIGLEGVIDIEESVSTQTEVKISSGNKIPRGWLHPLFTNNKGRQTCEFENPFILLYQGRINHYTQLERALTLTQKENRPLLVICEDVDDQGLGFLLVNVARNALPVCAIKAPEIGPARHEWMEDLALVTGGTYIASNRGLDIKEIELENFGSAKKVVVYKDETVIIGGEGQPTLIEEFVNDLKMNLAQAKNEDERYPIEKRIARITGGVAVIQVGAATEVEMKEKLDRFDDAVRATKSAIQEGFVAGGGTAFARISSKLNAPATEYSYDKGIGLVCQSLLAPLRQMAENTGVNPDEVTGWVLNNTGNEGYNTKTAQIENLVETGIIDSTKALRCALVNAASIAGMVLSTECLIESVY